MFYMFSSSLFEIKYYTTQNNAGFIFATNFLSYLKKTIIEFFNRSTVINRKTPPTINYKAAHI